MTDEHLPEFDSLTPCPAPPRLRASVLAAADEQLSMLSAPSDTNPTREQVSEPTRSHISPSLALRVGGWERAAELFVAASLVIGVGWNAWQWRSAPLWQASVFGAPVVPSAVTGLGEAVASVTDANVAQTFIEPLGQTTARTTDGAALDRDYQRLLDQVLRDVEPVL